MEKYLPRTLVDYSKPILPNSYKQHKAENLPQVASVLTHMANIYLGLVGRTWDYVHDIW